MIDQSYLQSIFHYDSETGDLFWKERPIEHFKTAKSCKIWNTSRVGKKAGGKHNCGYIQIVIDFKHYLAHRVIWCYVHGEFPENGIDHINGNRSDNRIINLREANASENMQNRVKSNVNSKTSKYLGVFYDKWRAKFCAQITIGHKKKSLGRFDTEEEARDAYLSAKRVLHPFGTI